MDYSDRTEPPSQRRLKEAREEGRVACSNDLTSALRALLFVGLLTVAGRSLAGGFVSDVQAQISRPPVLSIDVNTASSHLRDAMWPLVPPVLLLTGLLLAPVLSALIQHGPILAPRVIVPQAARIDPFNGIGRLLSVRSSAALLSMFVQLALTCTLIVGYTVARYDHLVGLMTAAPVTVLSDIGRLVVEFGFVVAGVLCVCALPDVVFQQWRYRRELRMTRQEVLDELRHVEGDPVTRRRRRRVHRELILGNRGRS